MAYTDSGNEHAVIYWVVSIITGLYGAITAKLWFDQNDLRKDMSNLVTKQDLNGLREDVRSAIRTEFDCLHATVQALEVNCPLRYLGEVRKDAPPSRSQQEHYSDKL